MPGIRQALPKIAPALHKALVSIPQTGQQALDKFGTSVLNRTQGVGRRAADALERAAGIRQPVLAGVGTLERAEPAVRQANGVLVRHGMPPLTASDRQVVAACLAQFSKSADGSQGPEPATQHRKSGGIRFSKEEQAIADYIEEHSGLKPEKNPLDARSDLGRQPDAFINGVPCEFKSPVVGCSSSTIKNEVNSSIRGGGQARFIVIDARGTGLTREEAELGIRRAMGISRGKVDQITIIGDDFYLNPISPKGLGN